MAHLWFRNDEDIWTVMPLDGHAVDVSVHPPRVLAEGFRLGEDAMAAVVRVDTHVSPVWGLVVAAEADVRVNGYSPVARLHVLEDRDEIKTAMFESLFFSTEALARVEEFEVTERPVFCGRCRGRIGEGMAVRCPHCGIWYHQTGERPCWTYAPNCAFCPQSTSLDAGFDWVPEA